MTASICRLAAESACRGVVEEATSSSARRTSFQCFGKNGFAGCLVEGRIQGMLCVRFMSGLPRRQGVCFLDWPFSFLGLCRRMQGMTYARLLGTGGCQAGDAPLVLFGVLGRIQGIISADLAAILL